MALVDYAWTTLRDVKEELKITGTADDEFLTDLINRVTDFIEHYCDRRFKATTYTNEEYSGDGTIYLVPRNWPINSIAKIDKRASDLNEDDWDEIDSEYYHIVQPGREKIFKIGGFSLGTNNYRITYNAGYTTIPHDLVTVVHDLVKKYYNDRLGSQMRSESLGEYSYTRFENDLRALGIDRILDMYRAPAI